LATAIIIAMILTALLYWSLRGQQLRNSLITQKNIELSDKNVQLSRLKNDLEISSDQLLNALEEAEAQRSKIEDLNLTLEKKVKERTKSLDARNKMLEQYAIYNSHVLRAPIAKLQGLTHVILSLDISQQDAKAYLDMIHQSSSELDQVTRHMQKLLEANSVAEFNQVMKDSPYGRSKSH
jgi:signal transduction histidine kinase